MSRAFVKESDGADGEELPELVVSPHRNFVTPGGLERIEATLARLNAGLSAARAAEDRSQVARIERDLRYWTRRRATAEVVAPTAGAGELRFGGAAVLLIASGERVRFRIVGEDESDPAQGLISYVSPLAEVLLGCRAGDVVRFRGQDAEVAVVE